MKLVERRATETVGRSVRSESRPAGYQQRSPSRTQTFLTILSIGLSTAPGLPLAAATQQTQPPTPATRQALAQGAADMAAGNFPSAVRDYTDAAHAAPQFAEAYLNLGLALQQAGQMDAARTALEKSLQLKPEMRGANLFLGIIDYRQNRYRDAEDRLQRETKIDPRDAKAYMWLGVCYLAEDRPQAAIGPLDKAYALDPKDTDILYHRGHAYLMMANASYDAMFQLNSDSMRVHQVLGEAYATGYRAQEAIEEFELAVKMAPRQPGLHEELADQYWAAGNLDKAAAAYRDELQIDPYAPTALYKLGSLEVLNGKPADGVDQLRLALRGDPSLSDAHYYVATGLVDLDRAQDALNEFHLAIAADPSGDRAMRSWYQIALVYRKLDNRDAAQAAMQNFLRMREQHSSRQDRRTAQIVRNRAALPVPEPDPSAAAGDP
jgi:tetratricopeptide (TPR) repeat protein